VNARIAWLATGLVALMLAACDGDGGDAPTATPGTATRTATAAVTRTATTVGTAAATPSQTAPPAASPTAPVATPTAAPEPGRVIYRGDPSRRAVTLTFDAGADAGFTQEILDILRAERIRAAFGLTGAWAEQNRELTQLIAADGHILINHSYSHASFTGRSSGAPPLTKEQRELELTRTETTVYRLTLRSTRPYFRPPFGDIDDGVVADVAAAGYPRIIMWTVDSFGWRRIPADEIVERSLSLAQPGAIYIMHVGSESADAAALPRIIAGRRAQGYDIIPLDEMIGG
jgi:peptidoglycan/xylan/chitin deacetylase (PgdA/CDA1 family)